MASTGSANTTSDIGWPTSGWSWSRRLWNSWESDAVTAADPEACIFADSAKVHYVNFEGIYFRSCGLLNTILSPQESPPGRLMVSRPGAHAGETSQ